MEPGLKRERFDCFKLDRGGMQVLFTQFSSNLFFKEGWLGFTGFSWVQLGSTGFSWVSLGFTGISWVLVSFFKDALGFTEFY